MYHVEAGEPSPIAGWVMSDEAMAELYDALERKLEAEDPSTLRGASTDPAGALGAAAQEYLP